MGRGDKHGHLFRPKSRRETISSFTCSGPKGRIPQKLLAGQVNSLFQTVSMNAGENETKRRTRFSQTARRGCKCLERVRVAVPACQSSLGSSSNGCCRISGRNRRICPKRKMSGVLGFSVAQCPRGAVYRKPRNRTERNKSG